MTLTAEQALELTNFYDKNLAEIELIDGMIESAAYRGKSSVYLKGRINPIVEQRLLERGYKISFFNSAGRPTHKEKPSYYYGVSW